MYSSDILEIINIGSTSYSLGLSSLLLLQPEDYLQYFTPFEFDLETIDRILSKVEKDIYLGIFLGEYLIGFGMLRGWDEGYEIPSIGIMVGNQYKRSGISNALVSVMISQAIFRKSKKIMAKVYRDNYSAYNLFLKHDFYIDGFEDKKLILVRSLHGS